MKTSSKFPNKFYLPVSLTVLLTIVIFPHIVNLMTYLCQLKGVCLNIVAVVIYLQGTSQFEINIHAKIFQKFVIFFILCAFA